MIRVLVFWLGCLVSLPAFAQMPHMEKCGAERINCIVDGDTFWLGGVKYRLEGIDTPEPQTNICGGEFEIALAHKASDRLLDLLNSNDWQMVQTGRKGYFKRDLVNIIINGQDVGELLIRERLARKWPNGDEWWCR